MLNAVRCCAPCVYACTLRTCSKLAKNRQRILFLIFREIWRVKNDKYRLGKKYANAERSHRFHSAEMFSHRFHSAEMFSHRFHRFTQIVRVRSVSHRIHRIHRSMVQKKSHRFHSAGMFSHRFHRFTQIVRVRSVSHRIHRIHRCMVQKKSHRFHRARRSLSLKHLCKSVKSVGVYLSRVKSVGFFCTIHLLSMLKSKCFDHYFHFKLRFYIQG